MREKIGNNLLEFITEYMGGNLSRFLRKHKNQHLFQLTYSKTLPTIRKENKKLYKKLLSLGLYPKDLSDILNITITLSKHFDIELDARTIDDLLEVEYELIDIISEYHTKIMQHRWNHNQTLFRKYWLPKEVALKEQKARGYTKINDFEDYDPKAAHVVSIANKDYYYPLNILTGRQQIKDETCTFINPYIIHRLVGVEGWTRIIVPI